MQMSARDGSVFFICFFIFTELAGGRYLRVFYVYFRDREIIAHRRVKIMIKKKTTFDYAKSIRKVWAINPRTRVKDNDMKNKKKRRQNEKKLIRDDFVK